MKKILCCLLILCLLFIIQSCSDKAKEVEAYSIKAKLVGELILGQASAYISLSKAYIAAWEYAKATGEDFKTSARHVLGAQAGENKIAFLSMKEKIAERLEKLEDPPKEYLAAQEKLFILHDLYLKLHEVTLNPASTQEKYEKSINDLIKKIHDTGKEFYSLLGM